LAQQAPWRARDLPAAHRFGDDANGFLGKHQKVVGREEWTSVRVASCTATRSWASKETETRLRRNGPFPQIHRGCQCPNRSNRSSGFCGWRQGVFIFQGMQKGGFAGAYPANEHEAPGLAWAVVDHVVDSEIFWRIRFLNLLKFA
jgi:hypothetical protein